MSKRYSCDYQKACLILHAVRVKGWTQTQAAIELEVSQGTVNHIIHGRRFPDAYPRPF